MVVGGARKSGRGTARGRRLGPARRQLVFLHPMSAAAQRVRTREGGASCSVFRLQMVEEALRLG